MAAQTQIAQSTEQQLRQLVETLQNNVKSTQGQLTQAYIRIKELRDSLFDLKEDKKKLLVRIERLERRQD